MPLSLDELLTHQKQIRLELGVTYANRQYKGLVSGEPILIQVSPAQFVAVPSQVGESNASSDTQVLTLGGRYGINSRTEASIMYGLLLFISNKSKKDNLKVISMMCAIFGLGFIFRFYQIESFYLFLHGLSVFVWLQFALNMFVAHNKIE